MFENLFLKLNLPGWIFVLAALVLAAIAYLYYYRTLPPLSVPRRTLLLILRAIVLIIVFFLILEPVLDVLRQKREKPAIAVLFDNSASMEIQDPYGERGDSLKFLLSAIQGGGLADSLDIYPFAFALRTLPLRGDSLSFQVDGTNISRAIEAVLDSLSGKNLQGIVLATDGIYNQGVNPLLTAQGSPAPIYTVLIGDSSVPRDVSIRRVQTNQITYVNKKLPLEVVIWHNGYAGRRVVLTITRNGKQMARRMVQLGASGFEQKEVVNITPTQPGDFNYVIRVEPLADEITDRNNRQVVRIRVLKSKINVLVLSGSPNFDRHFLSVIARQLTDYHFIFLTEKNTGKYYEGAFRSVALDSQDLFILHGFPTGISDPAQVSRLFQKIQQQKKPLLWFISRQTDVAQLTPYRKILPFRATGRLNGQGNQFAVLTAGGHFHPITQLDENESMNELLWKELPPIEVFPQIHPEDGARVLLISFPEGGRPSASGKGRPVCFTFRQGGIKQLVFNGANFGNWHFQLQEDPVREGFFSKFMDRVMRWLVNRDDIHQVQIQPLQQIYNVGEPVQFSGQVYDEFYQPIRDAAVTITLEGDSLPPVSEEMISDGSGYYQQSFSGLPEGTYHYRISAEKNEQTIGVRTGTLTVKPFFLEFQQIPADFRLLRQLAQEAGGRAYLPGEFLKKFPPKKMESRVQYITSEYFLWRRMYWLILLIAVLGVEWFFRKRWGLL